MINLLNMTYKASWDNATKIITISSTVVFGIILVGAFIDGTGNNDASPFFIAFMIVAIYAACYAYRPMHYTVTGEKLLIHRPLSNVAINRDQIASVTMLDDEMMKWTFRTFGVGGLFGYFGKFANSKLGSMTWYATRRKKVVLIRTIHDKKIIVTPDEAADFVGQFKVNYAAHP